MSEFNWEIPHNLDHDRDNLHGYPNEFKTFRCELIRLPEEPAPSPWLRLLAFIGIQKVRPQARVFTYLQTPKPLRPGEVWRVQVIFRPVGVTIPRTAYREVLVIEEIIPDRQTLPLFKVCAVNHN